MSDGGVGRSPPVLGSALAAVGGPPYRHDHGRQSQAAARTARVSTADSGRVADRPRLSGGALR